MSIGVDKIQLQVSGSIIRGLGYEDLEGWSRSSNCVKVDGVLHATKRTFYASNIKELSSRNGNLTIIDEPLKDKTEVLFNPTNFFGDYALTTDVPMAIEMAQDMVHKSGLDLDLSSAIIKRIDTTKDRVLSEPPQAYNSILANYLHFRRSSTKTQYQDGMWMGNKSREFTFYDRKRHLDIKKIDHDLKPNTARLEYKLLNNGRKSWAQNYGIYTPKDLTNDPEQYHQIFKDGLTNLMLKDVLEGDTINLSPITLINQLKEYKATYERNFLGYFYKDYGLLHLIDNFGIDGLIDSIGQVSNTETKVVRSRIKEDISRAMQLSQSTKGQVRRPIEYVQEIFEQYAKAV